MAEFVLVDTSAFVRLTGNDQVADQYRQLLADAWLAISFQVEAELFEFGVFEGWGPRRKQAFVRLLEVSTVVPHTIEASHFYVKVMRENRRRLRLCGDADVWVIAQALEHRVPLMTHDRNQARLAAAVGVVVRTQLS